LSAADYDAVVIEVWPDIWPAFQVFQAMGTQWRMGTGGVSGLDYNCLPWLMSLNGVDDEASAFNDIRVMESAALRVIHNK
jgi:hypothetical protein